MQSEDNYTRRRVYVSRRQKQRKRQHMIRLILFFLILGIILAVVLICGLIFKYKKETKSTVSPAAEPQSITLTPEPETPGPPLRSRKPRPFLNWTPFCRRQRPWPIHMTMIKPSPF